MPWKQVQLYAQQSTVLFSTEIQRWIKQSRHESKSHYWHKPQLLIRNSMKRWSLYKIIRTYMILVYEHVAFNRPRVFITIPFGNGKTLENVLER